MRVKCAGRRPLNIGTLYLTVAKCAGLIGGTLSMLMRYQLMRRWPSQVMPVGPNARIAIFRVISGASARTSIKSVAAVVTIKYAAATNNARIAM